MKRAEERLRRHEQIDEQSAIRSGEARRQHADDPQHGVADLETAAEDRGIAAEHVLPVAVADDNGLILAAAGVKDIAARGLHSEDVEVVV